LDGLTYDADTVMAALTDLGWSIAYEVEAGATTGRYVNRETGAPYDTGDVESSYRSALAKRS
jgi:hypothetical protein